MILIKIVTISLLSMCFVVSQVPIPNGGCPDFKKCARHNFNSSFDKIRGYYHLYASVPYSYQKDQKCTYLNFTAVSNEVVRFDKYELQMETQALRQTTGYYTLSPDGTMRTNYTELNLPITFQFIAHTYDYWIMVACNECGILTRKGAGMYAFALTRLAKPSCEDENDIIQRMVDCGFPEEYIIIQDHSNCEVRGCVKSIRPKPSSAPGC